MLVYGLPRDDRANEYVYRGTSVSDGSCNALSFSRTADGLKTDIGVRDGGVLQYPESGKAIFLGHC